MMTEMAPRGDLILLTGATGYVGGRLLKALEAEGHPVRCLVRQPNRLRDSVAASTEVVQGDVLDPDSLHSAMQGVDIAYYLIHSLASGAAFAEYDRKAATHFGRAAHAVGVRRIIYLGGLGQGAELSSHLASRQEVGHILRASNVLTIEFRASIIIGAGSLSFEMIRALVDRLPVMVTPRWVRTQAQPIAIDDVIAYLVAALDVPAEYNEIFEIGGRQRATYQLIMQEYADQKGLKRMMIPVPVLSPWLSGLWLKLVTPLQARVGRALIEGVRNETVVRDNRALQVFDIRPMDIRESIARALQDKAGTPLNSNKGGL